MVDKNDADVSLLSAPDLLVLNESRFLFVDVASQRAKQLRQGSVPRLDRLTTPHLVPHKLERVAMEEVRTGLISYEAPMLAAARAQK
jgi:DNA-directed RNA polymerase subunit K/omega